MRGKTTVGTIDNEGRKSEEDEINLTFNDVRASALINDHLRRHINQAERVLLMIMRVHILRSKTH